MADASNQLEDFRRPGQANSRLAAWSPSEPTFRWFKSYMHLAARTTPPPELEVLDKIKNRNLGSPITVSAKSDNDGKLRQFDIDYLLAAEEVRFLANALREPFPSSVCEIGAGFGRTAHALLSSHPEIARYVLLDLPDTLELSRAYLRQTLSNTLFEKVEFRNALSRPQAPENVSLWIQIDGFQEMRQNIIMNYLNLITNRATYAYFCNPVGKYRPEVAGLSIVSERELAIALSSGLSLEIIDPWNDASIKSVHAAHIARYAPDTFKCLASEESRLRPFYLHTLYEKPDAVT